MEMHFWEYVFTSYSASTYYHAFFTWGWLWGTEFFSQFLSQNPSCCSSCFPSPWFSTPSSSPVSQHTPQYRSISVKRWITSLARREHEAWAQCTLICLVSECEAGSITQAAKQGWGMVALIGLSCFLISKKAKWKHKVLRDWLGMCW